MWKGYDKDEIGIGVSDFFYPTKPSKVHTSSKLPNPCWTVKNTKGRLLVARETDNKEFLVCVFSSEVLAKGFLVTTGFFETMETVVFQVGNIITELSGYAKACVNPLSKKHWDAIIELRR